MDLDDPLIEQLAQVIHEKYRSRHSRNGSVVPPWQQLDEDTRNANRAQAQDIQRKLASIGYTIEPEQYDDFTLSDVEIEDLARCEHARWCAERTAAGWTYDTVRDDRAKHHPSLVPWEQLSMVERDKDRDAVRDIPAILAPLGLSITRRT